MLQRLLLFIITLLFTSPLSAAVVLSDGSVVGASEWSYYKAGQTIDVNNFKLPEKPVSFIGRLERVSEVDRVDGGGYWLHQRLLNTSDETKWVFNVSESIVDHIYIFLYTKGFVETLQRGYLNDFEFPLSYAASFALEKGESADILIYIESRYFTYKPNIELVSLSSFESSHNVKSYIVVACFGAILLLGLYNFFLGVWLSDQSNLYYSAYLFLSVVAWLAAFNAYSQLFQWQSYWLLITPFFLTVVCNSLYVIHFLDLKKACPGLVKYCYGFVVLAFLVSLTMPLLSMGQYMLLYGVVSSFWILGALVIGVKRLIEGYRPARFFVLGFSILALGIVASLLPLLVPSIQVRDSYVITLAAQAIDMLILSIALADRINLLRNEKEQTLEQLVKTEAWAFEKEKDAHLKLNQALEISEHENQRKSDFLRMVSHELRTPLYSIISSVEQWDEVDGDQGHRDLLDFMGYGAARLRMQIDNLVLLAETDAQDLDTTESVFVLADLVDSLQECVVGLINPGVEFDVVCDSAVPAVLMGDAYLFEHMLRTILENACKFTEHGKIEFYINWVNSALEVKIVDTGCGMTREQQRTMYNDFIQVSKGLERNSEGLGIGLTVCYRLSEVLGADLQIKSLLGEGTEVKISAPFTVDESHSEFKRPKIKVPKILIVEDNAVNAQLLSSLVQLVGGNPVIAESGQLALQLIESADFDLIFMDIQMPVMDGITATRWIRKRGCQAPIIAVTANSDMVVRAKCAEVGMNDFLVKPVRRSDIERVVERLFGEE